MYNKPARSNVLRQRIKDTFTSIIIGLSVIRDTRGIRSPHFWAIAALFVIGIFSYYVAQTPISNWPLFNTSYFTGVHDLQRTLFFIPIVYAAVVFRMRGGLIASLAFLCIVLPRALIYSPYPDPLLRALLFVGFATFISLLIALQLNSMEQERKANDELNSAYQKLNELHQKLKESQEKLIRAEKLSSLGQMSASIAHEINNPIAGILAYTQLLIKKTTASDIDDATVLIYLAKMEEAVIRCSKMVRSLMDFARQSSLKFSEVNLNGIIDNVLDLIAQLNNIDNIEIKKNLAPSISTITADSDQLQQVLINILQNAIHSMPAGGVLTLNTSVVGDYVKIDIEDTGYGIPPENMNRIFTPFFSTKNEVKGVGLGLAVSYGIIKRHNGTIDIQSKVGKGTTFSIKLPAHPENDEEYLTASTL
ncbi:MAG: ATP-binding protein [Dehalococcoidales bacterium]|nr:ATP-binding protein [Dehalococcoidales bacterium]